MHRAAPILAGLALAVAPEAIAKFGISKTHVTLLRNRPPEIPILSAKVILEVEADASDVSGEYVDTVRKRVREAIERTKLYRLVDTAEEDVGSVQISLSPPSAKVRDVTRYENQSVVIGQAEGWDDEKKHTFLYDVYGVRTVPVTGRLAEGRIEARVTVHHGESSRSRVVSASYSFEPLNPLDTKIAESLRIALVEDVATRAAAVVGYSRDPVEGLLAVNGELEEGNNLAKAGRFEDALGRWSSRTLKGDAEAARLHNMGVAHEAMAYRLPFDSYDHRHELKVARDLYRKAVDLDPGEKYFKDPLRRIEVSLRYAEAVRSFAEHIDGRGDEPDRGRKTAPAWIDTVALTPR